MHVTQKLCFKRSLDLTSQKSSRANLLFGEKVGENLGDFLARVQGVVSEKDEILDKRLSLLTSGLLYGFSGRPLFFRQ
jgi:hypothetical protein